MGFRQFSGRLPFILVLISVAVIYAIADSSKDTQECQQQLEGMATCLTYVEGEAKAPTPDCCSGLKQVLKDNRTCLCVIIRDRNDPNLGIQINVTLALGLPSICHASANVSKCPELLHLDPNSPEAQVFYQVGRGSDQSGSSPAPSPSVGGSSGSGKDKNDGCCSRRRWSWLEIVAGGVLVWCFTFSTSSHLFI